MKTLKNVLKPGNFYVRSSLFSILSLTGAFFNYALYPVLVRVLDPSSFGDFAAIVAISNQALGIMLAFNIISIFLVKSQPEGRAREYAQVLQKNLIIFFLGLVVILLLASPYLHTLLKINNVSYFIVLAGLLVISVPYIIWSGYLQGHKELVRVGVLNVTAAFAKLVFSVVLALLFGAIGGLTGIFVGAIIGLIIVQLYPGVKLPNLLSVFKKSNPDQRKYLLSLKWYFLGCMFVVGTLSFLQNFDITLAKALFAPETAGIYSGISILSNALYYVCFLLIWIILPEITLDDPKKNRQLLRTGYKLLSLLAGAALVFVLLFKNNIAELLLGKGFADQGNILIFAILYQTVLVAISMYAYYLLVVRKRRAYFLAASVLLSCVIIVPHFAHSTLDMVKLLFLSLLIGVSAFGIGCLLFIRRKSSQPS